MDTIVTMDFMDSLRELEDKKDLFNSLTYRERKISDTKQLELTGMCVNDFYLYMKDSINNVLTEDFDLRNRYNKTKFNSNIIDRQIDKYTNELNKVKNLDKLTFKGLPTIIKTKGKKELAKQEYIYQLEDTISYLKTIKKLNERETTTFDNVMIAQANSIIKMRISNETKLEVINAIIENCEDIIMAYDVSISYMYGDESKMEEGLKKLSKVTLNRITSYILGPASSILDYILRRSTNNIMMKLRQSGNPKDEMIKYRDRMENTLIILKEKKKSIEKRKEN